MESQRGLRPSSRRKRAAVLDAAEQVFLEAGFTDARVDDVAERSGVAKQTVYTYFGSKEGLFATVVERANAAAAGAVHRDEPLPSTPAELVTWLEAAARHQLDAVLAPRVIGLRRLVVAEARRHPALAAGFWREGPARSIDAFARTFAALHEAGLLHAPDARVAAEQFNWLVMGHAVNAATLLGDDGVPDAATRRAIAEAAVTTFLGGRGAGGVGTGR
ncbi:TetR/AcrR family transcriptional regulator [Phycicoccus flavus]|uniref:TetR/AcrR family transcriptional regulator n=1 Tax=Phycicoccus flavus TaxID=2502783 RepID=A0A8T6R6K2_9MICO|nr:TetR/AcrR family transcriptional regulator [Phycicoccus flavus]NHA69193.1 TetR/AcrR family transcriptional regulator [Phycicoccus flavus]